MKEVDHSLYVDDENKGKVDGVSADNDQKVIVAVLLDHPVEKDDDGNITQTYDNYQVSQVIWYKIEKDENKQDKLTKIYDDQHKDEYPQKDSYFVANYTTYPLTIKKLVTGNLGDKNKPFTINYSIHTNANYEKNLPLTYSESGGAGSQGPLKNKGDELQESDKTGDAENSFKTVDNYLAQLAHGQSVTIHGLAAVDTVKVWETFTKKGEDGKDVADSNADGYTVSYTKTPKDKASEPLNTNLTINGTPTEVIGGENTQGKINDLSNNYTATVKNEKNGTPITGIVHNYGPFALMAAVGAALIGFFFRRRREE